MGNQIFISYSRKDLDFANKLIADLKAAEFRVWYDKEIEGGSDWRQTIDDRIQNANQVIVILSYTSIASKWVQHEGSMAYGQGKKVFPLLIDPIADEDLPVWAGIRQCTSFVDVAYEDALDQLTKDLIPPNIAQDIIEREFSTYQHTNELMSAETINFINKENNRPKLSPEMEVFLEKSRREVKKNKGIRIGIISLTFVLIGIGAVLLTLGVTGQLNKFVYRPLPMEMVEIPAGEFLMGSLEGDKGAEPDEFPQRKVYLDTYDIGKYEVTNKQYDQCVKAGVCANLSRADSSDPVMAEYPAVYVNWEEAYKFCEWSGYRLPTEAEWEKAARFEDGNIFPWGNSNPDCSKANYGDCWKERFDENVGIVSVTIKQDKDEFPYPASEYGVMHMAGNVWEWVADRYDADYYTYAPDRNPTGPVLGVDIDFEGGNYYVVRGGSWGYSAADMRGANRGSRTPDKNNELLGFRCAGDIQQ